MIPVESARSRKAATYQDIIALPDNVVGEIVDGELSVSPRPAALHASAASGLLGVLFVFDRGGGPGGWVILMEPELHLGGQVMVPDLAGWRRARMPELPDGPFFTLAPDWVCEVASPSTALLDRAKKLPQYLRAGVGHAWIVDPVARTLEVFRADGDGWRLVFTYGGADQARVEPFEAIQLDLAILWSR